MTVRELIAALQKADPEAVVRVDGCEHDAPASSVYSDSAGVSVVRAQSECYYEPHQRIS